jgi:predicted nucleic acid-binding protein
LSRIYWDTSALLKLYIPENDSAYFIGLIAKTVEPVWTSAIAAVEFHAAMVRKERAGDVRRADGTRALNRFQKDCAAGRITRIPCGDETTLKAQELVGLARVNRRVVMIRSLDAIHVASALSVLADGIVTTDIRMREVAAMAGLKIIP